MRGVTRRIVAALAGVLALTGCDEAVKVSRFGYDPADSTRFIQAALDSGAKKVILDRQAGPWIATNLYGRSNQEFVFEEGVELLAKRGAFKGQTSKRGFNVTFEDCTGAEKIREEHPISDIVYDLTGGRERCCFFHPKRSFAPTDVQIGLFNKKGRWVCLKMNVG